MKTILIEQDQGFDLDAAISKEPDAAKIKNVDAVKPDVVKRDTGKVDVKKPDVKKPEVKKHGSNIDMILSQKEGIAKLIINGIQFYTQFFTYISKFDIDEEGIQRLFSTKLETKQHAQYCDLIMRIVTASISPSKLGKSIIANPKKYNYFLSRNFSSTSVDYLHSFYEGALSNGFNIKSLRGIFNNSDFIDYVWEDIPQKTKNLLITKGIIKFKSDGTYTVPFYTMTDDYIIQLVNTIYDNQIYGKPKSYLK
jgi:hypothetical protein